MGKHRLFLEELITALDALGYRVLLPWQVLNASFYGVPASFRTNHSEISRRRFAETLPGQAEPISRFFKLSADGLLIRYGQERIRRVGRLQARVRFTMSSLAVLRCEKWRGSTDSQTGFDFIKPSGMVLDKLVMLFRHL